MGRHPTTPNPWIELRDVLDALLYANRTGIQWNYLRTTSLITVYAYYAAWRDEGIFAQLCASTTASWASAFEAAPSMPVGHAAVSWKHQAPRQTQVLGLVPLLPFLLPG
ncbi:transposase [Streptomyces sp. NBC_01717]|uniref:transposase n=1 Tax=Streptomyces sp. NBC_01717 TaxID=2975918 RepID=UPI003FCD1DED